ncbi:thioredoxin domain-containing protein [Candidatus Dojkabacteria bacterium]|nr:thioredoxin domain-containing protein [Candidatus Dojkabacteria bacterium]
MAKTTQKSAPQDQNVIELDLKVILTPLAVLISGLFIGIVLIVGLYGINQTLKNGSTGVKGTDTTADTETTQETAGEQTTLSNGDAVSTKISDNTPIAGDTGAKVAIVEYSDFACGYCKRHATETLDQILSNYVDQGKVAYYFKSFPIFTPLNAAGGYCAEKLGGDSAFLKYHQSMYSQEQVTGEEAQILSVAKSIGLDEGSFKECLNSDEATAQATADYDEAVSLGIGGTPGFIVGKLNDDGTVEGEFVSGAQAYSYFEEVIAKYL